MDKVTPWRPKSFHFHSQRLKGQTEVNHCLKHGSAFKGKKYDIFHRKNETGMCYIDCSNLVVNYCPSPLTQ